MAPIYCHEPEGYSCPFCRVVARNLTEEDWVGTADILIQTESTTAFVAPVWWRNNPGHVLIVPNRHYENLFALPAMEAAAIHEVAQRIAFAMKTAYGCDGISARQHNEPAGNQDVWHYHVHLFPRYHNDHLYQLHEERRRTTAEERLPYAEQLRTALAS